MIPILKKKKIKESEFILKLISREKLSKFPAVFIGCRTINHTTRLRNNNFRKVNTMLMTYFYTYSVQCILIYRVHFKLSVKRP